MEGRSELGGKMGCLKAKDKFSGKLVKSTRVHFKKGKEMVKGLISSQMEGNGRGSGRTINKMDSDAIN